MTKERETRWHLIEGGGAIVWKVAEDKRLPHEDHVEMSGKKVSVIVTYKVDERRNLSVSRKIIWPTLRTQAKDVRGYLVRTYDDEATPELRVDGKPYLLPPVAEIMLSGITLLFRHEEHSGLNLSRQLFASSSKRVVLERWQITNVGNTPVEVNLGFQETQEVVEGVYGKYQIATTGQPRPVTLKPQEKTALFIAFSASKEGETLDALDYTEELRERTDQACSILATVVLETPDEVLNTAFEFAKFRAAESIFATAMGTVHSPGGGRYYGGVWANDQAEYSGPFFAFLGDQTARDAALTCYRLFAKYTNPEYKSLPSSLEVEGDVAWSGARDRGDAAMIAYGASRYALTVGDEAIARELRPLLDWCLEFCRRKTNADGVIESDSDELEGRFPTGKANLSTSTLAYGGLRSAAHLLRDLGDPDAAAEYDRRADALETAIETYFGATVEGYDTYRYYDGNDTLRAWICLPLCMGILSRANGTVSALFSPRLWTADGLATEAGDKVFWDRSTLYALRGVFAAGATGTALRYLKDYSTRRLLGDHVPYPVEAYPEGGQAHLSAESALYCRIFIEGLFGITPTGLRSFSATPRLPKGWDTMTLRSVHAFGHVFDVEVRRDTAGVRLIVTEEGDRTVFEDVKPDGEPFTVKMSPE